MPRFSRSTPEGGHRPVLLDEAMAALDPKPGEIAFDGTLGAAGHAAELLNRVGESGRLIACDLDPANIEKAQSILDAIGHPYELHAGNFAGIASFAANGVDCALADLGVSSMQIDDSQRGFSYMRDGPLDMRMDPNRGKTAAELLATISETDLAQVLSELGDYEEFGKTAAQKLAAAIVANRSNLNRTVDLAELILATTPPPPAPPGDHRPTIRQLKFRPVACAFQALRILVNRELANLQALLRAMPNVLRPGGRVAIISFHSGEDRIVKQALRDGVRTGVYAKAAPDAIRAGGRERYDNPRSRSAKLRWAQRA